MEDLNRIQKFGSNPFMIQNQLCEMTFDLDKFFDSKIDPNDEEDIFNRIIQFVNQARIRQDVNQNLIFREFFQLSQLDSEYLDEWSRTQVSGGDFVTVDFSWSPQNLTLVII